MSVTHLVSLLSSAPFTTAALAIDLGVAAKVLGPLAIAGATAAWAWLKRPKLTLSTTQQSSSMHYNAERPTIQLWMVKGVILNHGGRAASHVILRLEQVHVERDGVFREAAEHQRLRTNPFAWHNTDTYDPKAETGPLKSVGSGEQQLVDICHIKENFPNALHLDTRPRGHEDPQFLKDRSVVLFLTLHHRLSKPARYELKITLDQDWVDVSAPAQLTIEGPTRIKGRAASER